MSMIEEDLDSVFQKYAVACDYRKTKRGRAIVYQLDRLVLDFDICIVAERDGKTYVPSDFGYVWGGLPERRASNPRMQTDAAVKGDGGDEGSE